MTPPLRRTFGSWTVVAALTGLLLALPVYVPLPGFEQIPLIALTITVGTVFVVLIPQLLSDAALPRPGSAFRLVVALFVVAGLVAWAHGALTLGLTAGATLSLLNWIALAGLAVTGQVLFGDPIRISALLSAWTMVIVIAAAGMVTYLFAEFGPAIFFTTSRSPFQAAGRAMLPPWPNYFGLTLSVAACILYGRMLAGERRGRLWVQLGILLAALLVSFSRTAWVATAAGLLTMTAFGDRLRRSVPVFAGVIVLVGIGVHRIPAVRQQVLLTFTPGTSLQLGVIERLAFSAEATRIWLDHPVTGIGFRRFDEFASLSRVYATGLQPHQLGSVHNEYLSILLKGGVLVGLTWLLLVGGALGRFLRFARAPTPGPRMLGLIGLGMATALLAGGVAAESFRTVSVAAPFWLLAGAMAGPAWRKGGADG